MAKKVKPLTTPAPKPEHQGTKNLKPFVKGEDSRRNLKGRPVVTDIKKYIKERLNQNTTDNPDKSRLDAMVDKLIDRANKGNLRAMEIALSYGYGKPTQGLELSGVGGTPILTHDFSGLTNDQVRERIEQLRAITELPDTHEPDSDQTGD